MPARAFLYLQSPTSVHPFIPSLKRRAIRLAILGIACGAMVLLFGAAFSALEARATWAQGQEVLAIDIRFQILIRWGFAAFSSAVLSPFVATLVRAWRYYPRLLPRFLAVLAVTFLGIASATAVTWWFNHTQHHDMLWACEIPGPVVQWLPFTAALVAAIVSDPWRSVSGGAA